MSVAIEKFKTLLELIDNHNDVVHKPPRKWYQFWSK